MDSKYIIILIILFFILFILIIPKKVEPKEMIFVTSFIDIGRDKWTHAKRSLDDYFYWFHNLAKTIDYKLIVYINNEIKIELCSKYQFRENIVFIDIDRVDTFLNKYLDKEQKILDSNEFKRKIPDNRLGIRAETWNGKYNLLNHSKINFIKYSKKLYPNYKFYSWIDFGYVRNTPENTPKNLNLKKIPNKIIYETFSLPTFRIDEHDIYKIDDTIMKGSGFIVPNNLVDIFHTKYENKLKNWHHRHLCDDDESMVLQLYFDNPELFHIIIDKNWFSVFNQFK